MYVYITESIAINNISIKTFFRLLMSIYIYCVKTVDIKLTVIFGFLIDISMSVDMSMWACDTQCVFLVHMTSIIEIM